MASRRHICPRCLEPPHTATHSADVQGFGHTTQVLFACTPAICLQRRRRRTCRLRRLYPSRREL
eukprot:3130324-Pleurochrysis_carterae.AAC.1